VTEIPEHLLKRSRERRAALGLGGDDSAATGDSGEAAPAASTPATTAEAAPAAAPSGPAGRRGAAAPAAPPPPKPDSPVVAAHKRRPKIPVWAMAALSLMPIWVFMYVRSLTEPPVVAEGPMGVGAEIYTKCQSCHGGSGEGGSGRALHNGEVNRTFPNIEDQIRFVYFGTEGYNNAGITASYGDPNREGGAHTPGSFGGVMPAWGSSVGGELTDEEILGVVCHERYAFNGPDIADDEAAAEEFEDWCSEESPIFAAVEAGTPLADLDTTEILDAEGQPIKIIDIGTEPAPGSAKE
jgi:hypothetical protein